MYPNPNEGLSLRAISLWEFFQVSVTDYKILHLSKKCPFLDARLKTFVKFSKIFIKPFDSKMTFATKGDLLVIEELMKCLRCKMLIGRKRICADSYLPDKTKNLFAIFRTSSFLASQFFRCE